VVQNENHFGFTGANLALGTNATQGPATYMETVAAKAVHGSLFKE